MSPTFAEFINQNVITLINGTIIPGIFALAFLAFLWGVFRYAFAGDSQDDLAKSRDIMVYGIIVIAVMMSMWGILRVFKNTITNGVSGGGGSYQSIEGSPETMYRDVTNIPNNMYQSSSSDSPQTVTRGVVNTQNTGPEGFTGWMLNCFGYCRSTPSSVDPGNYGQPII